MATNEHGWISYVGGGDNSHLTEDQRQMVEERIRERQEQRGGLLGVVEVHVYEHGCHQQVTFPHGSLLGVETDASIISEMVARARAELANWR
jgi:transposase